MSNSIPNETQSNAYGDDGAHALLHPTLRNTFIAFPPMGVPLSQEKMESIFCADSTAIRDLWQLAFGNHIAPKR